MKAETRKFLQGKAIKRGAEQMLINKKTEGAVPAYAVTEREIDVLIEATRKAVKK